jgi:hypothetical protein
MVIHIEYYMAFERYKSVVKGHCNIEAHCKQVCASAVYTCI